MNITKETIVGELVAQQYRTASVFKRNKIDFCCNGNRSIAEACEEQRIKTDTVIEQLNNVLVQNSQTEADYTSWPLDLLADYIQKKHHRYVETRIRDITPFLEKVVRVHGERHNELLQVEKLFKASVGELTAHMKKEESILFPVIRRMAEAENSGVSIQPPFGSVRNPIHMMMFEHSTEGERFRQIAEITDDYTPPADACNTYRVTFSLLQEFEEDLHQHIHLENNILFPKAIALEKRLATA